MGIFVKNVSCDEIDIFSDTGKAVQIATLLVGLILIDVLVVFGNILVIVAVITSEKLRTVTNMYVASLASADCLLGITVLPFSTGLQAVGRWVFASWWCKYWLAVDVLLCTSSILNLCAISIDRYLAISRPMEYPSIMTSRKGKFVICGVWLLAALISLPPVIGWDSSDNEVIPPDIDNEIYNIFVTDNQSIYNFEIFQNNTLRCETEIRQCTLTGDSGYVIYSALGSFFIPAFVMVFVYFRIYQAAVRTAKSINRGVLTTKNKGQTHNGEMLTLRIHRGGGQTAKNNKNDTKTDGSNDRNLVHTPQNARRDIRMASLSTPSQDKRHSSVNGPHHFPPSELNKKKVPFKVWISGRTSRASCEGLLTKKRRSSKKGNPELKMHNNERKAAKTLAVVVGAFIVCWLPFFAIYFIGAFCDNCTSPLAFDIFFWLGYCNSALNPVIYALFSRDFRNAFRKLLLCHRRSPEQFCSQMYVTREQGMTSSYNTDSVDSS